jgi:hypothetical protein
MNVFISGSISINKLPLLALNKINAIIARNYTVLIGDAKGVDLLVQEYLFLKFETHDPEENKTGGIQANFTLTSP